MRAGFTLALLLAAASSAGAPAEDPDWHIPLANAGEPDQPDARRLRQALAHYEQLAESGGWPELPAGVSLLPGQRDASVPAIRDRLRISGDFAGLPSTADAWFFDGDLQRALADFQSRHGLPADGQLNGRTVAELNVPAGDRVQQLQVTLLRWNWLPRNPGPRYLWANVPGGSLELIENGAATLSMRIIAGHPDRPTPSFQDTVSQVVVNPSWSVPRRNAVEDLLPYQQEDATFLARLGIRVFASDGHEVEPRSVDWRRLNENRFPYRLRQDPGPLNSLGRLKFVLANPWDIFLHDTPSRRLFDLNSRTLSSGCLRLEKPEELAGRLLSPAGVASAGIPLPLETRGLDSRGRGIPADATPAATRTIRLARPILLYVVYLTAWVTPDGVVNFRPDVYGRDARLR